MLKVENRVKCYEVTRASELSGKSGGQDLREDPVVNGSVRLFYADDAVRLYHGDADDVLPALALDDVALVLTDPPYNVSSRDARANTSVGRVPRKDGTYREIVRNFGEWDHDWNPAVFLSQVDAMLRDGGSLVAFTSEFLMQAYLDSDFDHRGLLYWRKTNPAPNFRKQIVRAIEMAVWQVQGLGGWTFNEGGYRPNVWDGPIINGYTCQNTAEERWHPTQKPEWLMNEWVALFSNPGDLVVDPYCGSGTTLVAAKRLGRRAIGVDVDAEYCAVAAKRLRQAALDLFPPTEAQAKPQRMDFTTEEAGSSPRGFTPVDEGTAVGSAEKNLPWGASPVDGSA